jgi:ATP-dependent Lon protease
VLAAYRAAISEVILPDENQKDLEEIPEDVREAMQFHLVKNMAEVVPIAFDGPLPEPGEAAASKQETRIEKRVAH